MEADVSRFNRTLFWWFAAFSVGLLVAIAFQVHFGLMPLRRVSEGLARIREGRARRLEGSFPAEIAPLASELNSLIAHSAEVVGRARGHVANLAHSLVQHADDTFELVDTILVGLVHRLELDGTGPDTIAKLQAYLPTRKSSDRIRGIFVYDETGRWLATTENVDFSGLNNSDREYFQQHRASPDKGTLIGRPIKSRAGGQCSARHAR